MPSHQNEPISTMTNPTANYNIGDSDCRHYTNLDNQSPYSCYISDSIPQNHGASAHQYAQQDTPSTMDRREEGHSPYYLGDTTHTRGGAYDYEGLGATSNYRLMHQQSPTYDMQPSSYNRDREASAATAGQQRGDYYHQQSKWQEMYNYDDYDHQSQQQQRLFSSGSAYEPSLYQQQQQGGGYDSSDRNMPHYPQSTAAAGLQGSSSYSSGAYDYQYQRQKQLSPLPILPDYQHHHHRRPLLSHETGPPSNNYDQQMNNYRQLQQQQQRIPSSLGHGQQLVKLEDGRCMSPFSLYSVYKCDFSGSIFQQQQRRSDGQSWMGQQT